MEELILVQPGVCVCLSGAPTLQSGNLGAVLVQLLLGLGPGPLRYKEIHSIAVESLTP